MKTLKSILPFAWGGLLVGSFASSGFGGEAFDGSWRVNASTKTQDSRCKDRSISLVVEDGSVKYVGLLSGTRLRQGGPSRGTCRENRQSQRQWNALRGLRVGWMAVTELCRVLDRSSRLGMWNLLACCRFHVHQFISIAGAAVPSRKAAGKYRRGGCGARRRASGRGAAHG